MCRTPAAGRFQSLRVAVHSEWWHDAIIDGGFLRLCQATDLIMFINPMWDSETQRIGKQKCTPLGYKLHLASDVVGFVALLLLLATFAYLRYRSVAGTFHASLWWLLAVPFGLAFGGTALHSYSWLLARRKGFQYNYESSEASWLENGQQRVFKWPASQETRIE